MPSTIKVRLIEARDLPVMDSSSNSSDTFVTVHFDKKRKYKSKICYKSLNPVWDQEFRIEVTDDTILQDQSLIFKVWDKDTYSADDPIGMVTLDLDPLLLPDSPARIHGWFPVFDTLRGLRGFLRLNVRIQHFSDLNIYKESAAGVLFFTASSLEGFTVRDIHGFVEELVMAKDPEYAWVDSFRSSRTSNEERLSLMSTLAARVRRFVGRKAITMGSNAVLGYSIHLDFEDDTSTIVARGYGTACTVVKSASFPQKCRQLKQSTCQCTDGSKYASRSTPNCVVKRQVGSFQHLLDAHPRVAPFLLGLLQQQAHAAVISRTVPPKVPSARLRSTSHSAFSLPRMSIHAHSPVTSSVAIPPGPPPSPPRSSPSFDPSLSPVRRDMRTAAFPLTPLHTGRLNSSAGNAPMLSLQPAGWEGAEQIPVHWEHTGGGFHARSRSAPRATLSEVKSGAAPEPAPLPSFRMDEPNVAPRAQLKPRTITLLTMSEFPRNMRVQFGGLVSSRSVQVLTGKTSNVKVRDRWWREVRQEMKSHALRLNCNAVIGYREQVTFENEVLIISCTGTAARLSWFPDNLTPAYHFEERKQASPVATQKPSGYPSPPMTPPWTRMDSTGSTPAKPESPPVPLPVPGARGMRALPSSPAAAREAPDFPMTGESPDSPPSLSSRDEMPPSAVHGAASALLSGWGLAGPSAVPAHGSPNADAKDAEHIQEMLGSNEPESEMVANGSDAANVNDGNASGQLAESVLLHSSSEGVAHPSPQDLSLNSLQDYSDHGAQHDGVAVEDASSSQRSLKTPGSSSELSSKHLPSTVDVNPVQAVQPESATELAERVPPVNRSSPILGARHPNLGEQVSEQNYAPDRVSGRALKSLGNDTLDGLHSHETTHTKESSLREGSIGRENEQSPSGLQGDGENVAEESSSGNDNSVQREPSVRLFVADRSLDVMLLSENDQTVGVMRTMDLIEDAEDTVAAQPPGPPPSPPQFHNDSRRPVERTLSAHISRTSEGKRRSSGIFAMLGNDRSQPVHSGATKKQQNDTWMRVARIPVQKPASHTAPPSSLASSSQLDSGFSGDDGGWLPASGGGGSQTGVSTFPVRATAPRVCSQLHLPYAPEASPFQVNVSPCGLCGRRHVPDVLLSTTPPHTLRSVTAARLFSAQNQAWLRHEDGEGTRGDPQFDPSAVWGVDGRLPVLGRGVICEVRVVRAIPKALEGEDAATMISEALPFLDFDMHRQLMYKLRLLGMNAGFGLQVNVELGETLLVMTASCTAVYTPVLPPIAPLMIHRTIAVEDAEDQRFVTLQRQLIHLSEQRAGYWRRALAEFRRTTQFLGLCAFLYCSGVSLGVNQPSPSDPQTVLPGNGEEVKPNPRRVSFRAFEAPLNESRVPLYQQFPQEYADSDDDDDEFLLYSLRMSHVQRQHQQRLAGVVDPTTAVAGESPLPPTRPGGSAEFRRMHTTDANTGFGRLRANSGYQGAGGFAAGGARPRSLSAAHVSGRDRSGSLLRRPSWRHGVGSGSQQAARRRDRGSWENRRLLVPMHLQPQRTGRDGSSLILQIDDEADEDMLAALLEPAFPENVAVVSTFGDLSSFANVCQLCHWAHDFSHACAKGKQVAGHCSDTCDDSFCDLCRCGLLLGMRKAIVEYTRANEQCEKALAGPESVTNVEPNATKDELKVTSDKSNAASDATELSAPRLQLGAVEKMGEYGGDAPETPNESTSTAGSAWLQSFVAERRAGQSTNGGWCSQHVHWEPVSFFCLTKRVEWNPVDLTKKGKKRRRAQKSGKRSKVANKQKQRMSSKAGSEYGDDAKSDVFVNEGAGGEGVSRTETLKKGYSNVGSILSGRNIVLQYGQDGAARETSQQPARAFKKKSGLWSRAVRFLSSPPKTDVLSQPIRITGLDRMVSLVIQDLYAAVIFKCTLMDALHRMSSGSTQHNAGLERDSTAGNTTLVRWGNPCSLNPNFLLAGVNTRVICHDHDELQVFMTGCIMAKRSCGSDFRLAFRNGDGWVSTPNGVHGGFVSPPEHRTHSNSKRSVVESHNNGVNVPLLPAQGHNPLSLLSAHYQSFLDRSLITVGERVTRNRKYQRRRQQLRSGKPASKTVQQGGRPNPFRHVARRNYRRSLQVVPVGVGEDAELGDRKSTMDMGTAGLSRSAHRLYVDYVCGKQESLESLRDIFQQFFLHCQWSELQKKAKFKGPSTPVGASSSTSFPRASTSSTEAIPASVYDMKYAERSQLFLHWQRFGGSVRFTLPESCLNLGLVMTTAALCSKRPGASGKRGTSKGFESARQLQTGEDEPVPATHANVSSLVLGDSVSILPGIATPGQLQALPDNSRMPKGNSEPSVSPRARSATMPTSEVPPAVRDWSDSKLSRTGSEAGWRDAAAGIGAPSRGADGRAISGSGSSVGLFELQSVWQSLKADRQLALARARNPPGRQVKDGVGEEKQSEDEEPPLLSSGVLSELGFEKVEFSPLSHIPGCTVVKNLGLLQMHVIKECSDKEGVGALVYRCMHELQCMARAHVLALEGNALLAYRMTDMQIDDESKSEAYVILSIQGDIVRLHRS